MSKINKMYIQNAQKLDELKDTFLTQKKDQYIENILSSVDLDQKQLNKFISTSTPSKKLIKHYISSIVSSEKLINEIISTSVSPKRVFYKFLQSSSPLRIVKTIELIEPAFNLEIIRASEKLVQLRDEFECVDISEEIWNYTKNFIQDISEEFWNKSGRHLPTPKFEFIDESIEIRWIRSDTKLVLSITDYFDDIIVYVKTSKGQYLSQPVPKSEIRDWVFFWLNQIWNH